MPQRQLPLSELSRTLRLGRHGCEPLHRSRVAGAIGGVDGESGGIVDEAAGDADSIQTAGVQLFAQRPEEEAMIAMKLMYLKKKFIRLNIKNK